MTEPVIASVAWDCDACAAHGMLHLACSVDVLGLMGRVKQLHREASPDCTVACPTFEQVETDATAEVNDPRERSINPAVDRAIHEPRPRMRPHLITALAAMLAVGGTGSTRYERRAERPRTKHDDAAIERANAKRARKAQRRSLFAPLVRETEGR